MGTLPPINLIIVKSDNVLTNQKVSEYYVGDRPEVRGLLLEHQEKRAGGRQATIRILDVGCGEGHVSRQLAQDLPQAIFDGVEFQKEAADVARSFYTTFYKGTIEGFLDKPTTETAYDYIILADLLEHLVDPWNVLRQLRSILHPHGRLIISLPNVGHYSILKGLLTGRWEYRDAGLLDRTHLRFFTLQDALTMFKDTGYRSEDTRCMWGDAPDDIQPLIQAAAALGASPERFQAETQAFQYLFVLAADSTI